MGYVSIGLGDTGDIVEKCGAQLKSADLDTKAGREATVQTAAECAADGVCAAYKVPPGICGPVAKVVVGEVIKVWNDVFGDDSAQREALRRRRETAAFFAAQSRLLDLDNAMAASLAESSANLIKVFNKLVTLQAYRYGGKKPYTMKATVYSGAGGTITIAGFEDDLPMRKWLVNRGMIRETQYLNAYDKSTGQVYPPRLVSRSMFEMDAAATAARNAALAQCNTQVGLAQTLCQQKVGSLSAYKTQYMTTLGAVAEQFYVSLSNAELRVRADITAQAVEDRLIRQLKLQSTTAEQRSTNLGGMIGAGIFAAGAVAAAVVYYKRSKR